MWRNRSITQLSFRMKWIASLDSHAEMSLKTRFQIFAALLCKKNCFTQLLRKGSNDNKSSTAISQCLKIGQKRFQITSKKVGDV